MNPSLAVRDHLPEHLADLAAEKLKLMTRVHQINEEMATCQTLLDLFPLETVHQ